MVSLQSCFFADIQIKPLQNLFSRQPFPNSLFPNKKATRFWVAPDLDFVAQALLPVIGHTSTLKMRAAKKQS
jgi:hypothetical protein